MVIEKIPKVALAAAQSDYHTGYERQYQQNPVLT